MNEVAIIKIGSMNPVVMVVNDNDMELSITPPQRVIMDAVLCAYELEDYDEAKQLLNNFDYRYDPNTRMETWTTRKDVVYSIQIANVIT